MRNLKNDARVQSIKGTCRMKMKVFVVRYVMQTDFFATNYEDMQVLPGKVGKGHAEKKSLSLRSYATYCILQ